MSGCFTASPATVHVDCHVFEGAGLLLTALSNRLQWTIGGSPCRAAVYPGMSIPMDSCDAVSCGATGAGGMAGVRVASIDFVAAQALTQLDLSDVQVAVTYELAVYRCAHTITQDATGVSFPTPAQLLSDSAVVLDDAAAMRLAVKCDYLGSECHPRLLRTQAWTPAGPAGGCVGGRMQLTVILDDKRCAAHA